MKYPRLMLTAAVVAALGAGGVLAQTTAPAPTSPVSPPVVTDAGPPPAEDRSSAGAIVLDKSLVKAQRENAFQNSSSKTGVGSVGRDVTRMTRKARVKAELAKAREEEAIEFHRRGAGSQTVK